ncbi:hypothetical protein B0T22DRAFT_458022 [Podospora appendiculata]|uniref:Secreted protein n=1 Tax=Podospora appendiculata TaxID=314037 RepID=A0AAE0X840_9PEZI|nr:hypothetical protein B0T22DRAFT_458022 [Podospora appendiculata]
MMMMMMMMVVVVAGELLPATDAVDDDAARQPMTANPWRLFTATYKTMLTRLDWGRVPGVGKKDDAGPSCHVLLAGLRGRKSFLGRAGVVLSYVGGWCLHH